MLILAAIAGGVVLGFVNGFLVTKWNLKPFVATLSTMALAQGLTPVSYTHLDVYKRQP